MNIHLSQALHNVISQLRTSSHQIEIEVGRYARMPLEERICQLYHQGAESQERYVCQCSVFYEIRERYHCLFKQGFVPLRKVMKYEDQWCLGFVLLELKRHTQKLLKDNSTTTQAHQQRALTTFFSPITLTHVTRQYGLQKWAPDMDIT